MAKEINVVVGVNARTDEASAKFKKLEKDISGNKKATKKLGESFGDLQAKIGAFIAVFAGFKVVGGAIKTITTFQQKLADLASISKVSRKALSELAIEAGSKTKYTASQAANAMESFVQAGINTDEALRKVLIPSLNLATVGNLELKDATSLLTTVFSQMGGDYENAERYTNLLAGAALSGKVSVGDFAESMKGAGPITAQYGIDLKQTLGILTELGTKGFVASEQGTLFRRVMTRLAKPTAAMEEVFSKFNIQLSDIKKNLNDPIKLFKLIRPAIDDVTDAATVLGVRGIGMASVIKNTDGVEKFVREVDGMRPASEIASDRLKTLSGTITIFKSKLEALLLNFNNSTGIVTALNGMARGALFVFEKFQMLPQPIKSMSIIFISLTGVIGTLSIAFKVLGVTAIAALGPIVVALSPVLLSIAAISAGVAGLYGAIKVISIAFKTFEDSIKSLLSKLKDIGSMFFQISKDIFNALAKIVPVFALFKKQLQLTLLVIQKIISFFNNFSKNTNSLGTSLKKIGLVIKNLIDNGFIKLGIAVDRLGISINNLLKKYNQMRLAMSVSSKAKEKFGNAIKDLEEKNKSLNSKIDLQNAKMLINGTLLNQNIKAVELKRKKIVDTTLAMKENNKAFEKNTDALVESNEKLSESANKIKKLETALKSLSKEQGLSKQELKSKTKAFNLVIEAEKKNYNSIKSGIILLEKNREVLSNNKKAIQEKMKTDVEASGKKVESLASEVDAEKKLIETKLNSKDLNKEEKELLGIKDSLISKIQTTGAAYKTLQGLKQEYQQAKSDGATLEELDAITVKIQDATDVIKNGKAEFEKLHQQASQYASKGFEIANSSLSIYQNLMEAENQLHEQKLQNMQSEWDEKLAKMDLEKEKNLEIEAEKLGKDEVDAEIKELLKEQEQIDFEEKMERLTKEKEKAISDNDQETLKKINNQLALTTSRKKQKDINDKLSLEEAKLQEKIDKEKAEAEYKIAKQKAVNDFKEAENSRKIAMLQKANKLAETIIDTVLNVAKWSMLGNVPMAILAGAAGAVSAGAIAAQPIPPQPKMAVVEPPKLFYGGEVEAGQPFIAGEQLGVGNTGELFIPKTAGTVIPSFKVDQAIDRATVGGAKTVNNNINVEMPDVNDPVEFVKTLKQDYDIDLASASSI